MKTQNVKKRTLKGNLQTIIHGLLPTQTPTIIPEGNTYIGAHRFTQNTVAKEFEELKKDYGLKIFFKDHTLYVGWIIPANLRNKARFQWAHNIIEDNLTYQRKEDIRLKIKAISVQKNNKRISIEIGDKEGEQRTVYAYDLTKAQLEAFAQKEWEQWKQTKYEGTISVFGSPVMHKTDIVQLKGKDGNTGAYLIKRVTRTFGANGYRQELELGGKVG